MKVLSVLILVGFMAASAVCLTGCTGQGQTAAELKRQRIRSRVVTTQQFHDDMETIWLVDKPSRLTEYSVR